MTRVPRQLFKQFGADPAKVGRIRALSCDAAAECLPGASSLGPPAASSPLVQAAAIAMDMPESSAGPPSGVSSIPPDP